MAYTIANSNNSFFERAKPWLTYILLFALLGGLAYGVTIAMQKIPSFGQKNKLGVNTLFEKDITVLVDGKEVGKTPLEKIKLASGSREISLSDKANPARNYTATINSAPQTYVLIDRDLGISATFSSGQDLWMEKGKTNLTVISQPSGASVFVDGTEVGRTPMAVDKVTGGSYALKIQSPGYETQTAQLLIKEGYNTNASFKLFPVPMNPNPYLFEGSDILWDLTIGNENIAGSPERAKAVGYWIRTRDIALSETEDIVSPYFGFYIDHLGGVYGSNGDPVTTPEGLEVLATATRGAYLGAGSVGTGLSPQAKTAYQEIFSGRQTATVLPTGTGWLRVRSGPNLSADELAKVNTGQTFPVLEAQTEWVKIKLEDGQEGWVSATFVELSE